MTKDVHFASVAKLFHHVLGLAYNYSCDSSSLLRLATIPPSDSKREWFILFVNVVIFVAYTASYTINIRRLRCVAIC